VKLLCLGLFLSINLFASPLDAYREANETYQKGNYEGAIEGYSKILREVGDNADVHYNLGNSYFRNEKWGLALYHFRKALELRPRDPDMRFNLNYARERATDKIETRGFRILSLTADYLTQREWLTLLAMLSLVGSVLSILQFFRPRDSVLVIRNLCGALFLVSSVCAFGQFSHPNPFGVVIEQEAKVLSGVGRDNVLLFTLHEGAEFDTLSSDEEGWIQIEIADGKRGWLRRSAAKL